MVQKNQIPTMSVQWQSVQIKLDKKVQKDSKKGVFLKWCHVSESNQGHRDFQSLALPTELTWHGDIQFFVELVEQALL